MTTTFHYEEKLFTPEEASEILRTRNQGNRSLARTKVQQYAEAMRQGLWRLTPVPIIFEEYTGRVLDGQNRLKAVVDSGIAQRFIVCTNARAEIMGAIDQGRSRSASDHLKIEGIDKATRLSPILLAIIGYEKCPDGLWSQTKAVSNFQYKTCFDKHSALVVEAAGFGYGHHRSFKLISCTDFAFSYFLLRTWGFEQADLVDFYNKLSSGAQLEEGSPVLAFRSWIQNNLNKYSGLRSRRQHTVNNILKAFSQYYQERRVQRFTEAGLRTVPVYAF